MEELPENKYKPLTQGSLILDFLRQTTNFVTFSKLQESLAGTLSEYQMVRIHKASVSWAQTVCKYQQQMINFAANRQRVTKKKS